MDHTGIGLKPVPVREDMEVLYFSTLSDGPLVTRRWEEMGGGQRFFGKHG